MSFRDWLSTPVATATVATSATDNAEGIGSVATVANVAVATPPERNFEGYHRAFSAAWKRERELLRADPEAELVPAEQLDAALWSAVNAWNGMTGDFRTAAELQAHLAPEDMADRELMTPAGLALYCWTLWADA